MEGAAIAQACYLNSIPFLIVRAISDKADDSATVDYPALRLRPLFTVLICLLRLYVPFDSENY